RTGGKIERPKTQTFHLPCSECTITLEGLTLQLGLPVDGRVITRPVIILNKEDLCNALLRKVPNKFQGVLGVVVATIFTSLSRRPLYISTGDKVELSTELCGTTGAAQRYLAIFEWRQNILPPSQGIKALHKLDLWGKSMKIDGNSIRNILTFGKDVISTISGGKEEANSFKEAKTITLES
ncbi:hypothetical protein Goari_002883, partial [Gossypium aridum]|nr:hypothetical protein [Gossypium aridum]